MSKSILMSIIFAIFVSGCASKKPISTIEATDYAMSCNTLLTEINETRSKWQHEESGNTAKNIVGGILTLGIYDANEEDELMLRERVKSLQLIYTIKQAKGECNELSAKDVQVDSGISNTIKNTKQNTKNAIDAIKN